MLLFVGCCCLLFAAVVRGLLMFFAGCCCVLRLCVVAVAFVSCRNCLRVYVLVLLLLLLYADVVVVRGCYLLHVVVWYCYWFSLFVGGV